MIFYPYFPPLFSDVCENPYKKSVEATLNSVKHY
jgi:hypothetical protein